MTLCDLSESITLEFLSSGIKIQPYTADIRARRRNYAHGNFELSEEAGELVAEELVDAEPVLVKFGGVPARRMYAPSDAVTFERDLGGFVKAELTLLDARKVMSRGTFSKAWSAVSFGDAIEYIMNEVDDPEGVITSYGFVSKEDSDEVRRRLLGENQALEDVQEGGSKIRFSVPGGGGIVTASEEVSTRILRFIDQNTGLDTLSDDVFAGFDFDKVTPLEAMAQVTREFEENWWVEPDGSLYIGTDGTRGQVVGTVAGNNSIALSRYSVTSDANRTNTVQVSGPYNATLELDESNTWLNAIDAGDKLRAKKNIQLIAEATDPTIEGSAYAAPPSEQKTQTTPEALERGALGLLSQRMMDQNSGSIAVNGLASSNVEGLAKLDIGDHIVIDDTIETRCDKDVLVGPFLVTSVQHRVNDRQGWHIELRVTRVPDYDSIETRSVFYDPTTDTAYEDLEAFQNDNKIELEL